MDKYWLLVAEAENSFETTLDKAYKVHVVTEIEVDVEMWKNAPNLLQNNRENVPSMKDKWLGRRKNREIELFDKLYACKVSSDFLPRSI